MKKQTKWRLIWWLGMAIIIAISVILGNIESEKDISYAEFVSYVQSDEVEKVEVVHGEERAKIKLKNGKERNVKIPSIEAVSDLITQAVQNNKEIDFVIKKEGFSQILIRVLDKVMYVLLVIIIVLLTIAFTLFVSTKSNDNEIQLDDDPLFNRGKFGKEATSNISFDDVAGIDEEKQQLQEIVSFLKDSEKYTNMGAKIPKGILLTGDPGVGKTLLAKAIAGEAEVPFFQVSGSSFEDTYVGVGSRRVRTLFKKARAKAPSIIFIDEIDTVGAKRYSSENYGAQTLNQLLAEMDGFDSSSGVVVIAATNYPKVLDPAITRPGRFDRKIYVPMPDVYARTKILEVHSRNKKLDESVSLEGIAKKTVGFSGADLRNLLNEAAINAVNRDAEVIQQQDLDEAFARIVVGLEKKNRRITDEDKYHTAVHEAGHAIVSAVLQPNVENLGISIVPRGTAGGYNLLVNNADERIIMTKEDAISSLAVSYAGKAAEKVILNKVSSGPISDLKQASDLAYSMVLEYGMCGSLLTLVGDKQFDSVLIEKNTKVAEKICEDAYQKSENIVENNKEVIVELAKILMDKEVLSAEEVKAFLEDETLVLNNNNETDSVE